MKNKILISLIAVSAMLLVVYQSCNANVWRVNYNPAFGQWTNHQVFTGAGGLQQAVSSNAVMNGDTIYVEASATNYSAVVITGKYVTIIGTGYYLTQNLNLQNNTNASTVVSIHLGTGADGTQLIGLSFPTGVGAGIFLDNVNLSNITIKRCRILNDLHFNGNSSTTLNNIQITQCWINVINTGAPVTNFLEVSNNYFETGFEIKTNVLSGSAFQNVIKNGAVNVNSFEFYNNIILGNSIAQGSGTSANIHNNIFDFALPTWLTGSNNYVVVQSIIFSTASTTNDGMYQVNNSSICVECFQGFPYPNGAGTEIGMYGGSAPYVLSGIPGIPAIYKLQSIGNGLQGSSAPVIVSTRSNQ